MPIFYLRKLAGDKRSTAANRHLGLSLTFIAGAMNAGGFIAVDQYTSHMTGIVSSVADNLVLLRWDLVWTAVGSIAAFVSGAAYSSVLINWGRHHRTHSQYAYPLLWEAALLLVFGLMGGTLELHQSGFIPMTVALLCFIMGLQNAIITKISNAEIRTTHMTGIITDLGIELGKLVYINSRDESFHYKPVHANKSRLLLLLSLLCAFSCGGVVGALGFKAIGYTATIPLALFLIALAIVPLVDDMRTRRRVLTRYWLDGAVRTQKQAGHDDDPPAG